MGQDNCDPKPGDLIEIDRPLYQRLVRYQHWVIYVGDEDVIHVTDERDQSLSGSSMSVLKNRARVKRQHLKEVVGNNKWRVNNKYDHSYTPLPVKKIIQHAERWVGREVPYDVLESNCEHFVTWLRYGVAVSEQAMAAVAGTTIGVGVVGAVATIVMLLVRQ